MIISEEVRHPQVLIFSHIFTLQKLFHRDPYFFSAFKDVRHPQGYLFKYLQKNGKSFCFPHFFDTDLRIKRYNYKENKSLLDKYNFMFFKKIIVTVLFFFVVGLTFNFGYSVSQASGLTEAQIGAILGLLQAFEASPEVINNIENTLRGTSLERPETTVWCYSFDIDLRVGTEGIEVRALQTALEKEGLYEKAITGRFDEYTASAVVAFQEKYREKILDPWGLARGSGFVGQTTRAKLNGIYGCGIARIPVPITSISIVSEQEVSGGAISVVRWESEGIERGHNIYIHSRSVGEAWTQVAKLDHNSRYYTWRAPKVERDTEIYLQVGVWDGSSWLASDRVTVKVRATEKTDSSITIISPEGGEMLPKESMQSIIWSYSPLPPKDFAIDLIYAGSEERGTNYNLKRCGGSSDYRQGGENNDKFWINWEVGYDINGREIPKGSYIISISDCKGTMVMMDEPITITDGPVPIIRYIEAPAAEARNLLYRNERSVVYGSNFDTNESIHVTIVGDDVNERIEGYRVYQNNFSFTVPNLGIGEYELFVEQRGLKSNKVMVEVKY